jgi:hypothetical protein
MIVHSPSAASFAAGIARPPSSRQDQAASPANTADTVQISPAAREALAAAAAGDRKDKSVDARLAAIEAKNAVSRTAEERDYVLTHDRKLAEIVAQGKSPDKLTAEELDYMQKATGMVNTMANLSPAEKALYDKAVASGNAEAAAGISQIALIRMMGHTAGGANGSAYDPLDTEITAANIGTYFRHSIVDPSGKAESHFQALIRYLQDNATA